MLASRPQGWRLCRICLATACCFALLTAGARAQGSAVKKYQIYLNQLKARFQQWDVDGNNALDKGELAKAFRGPQAKPYDYVASTEPTTTLLKKGKVKAISLALSCLPRPGLAVNLTVAELLSRLDSPKTKDPAPNTAYTQYADYQFLTLLGKTDQITKQDFDNWSKGYAKNLDRLQELQREVKASANKMAAATTPKAKQAASAALAQHQADLAALNAQLSTIPPAVQAGLNVQR